MLVALALIGALVPPPGCPATVRADPSLEASLRFRDGAWHLTARHDHEVLERTFRLPETDCALAADTAALALERFVRDLGPTPALPVPKRPKAVPQPVAQVSRIELHTAQAAPVLALSAPVVDEPQHPAMLSEFEPEPGRWTFALSAGAAGVLAGDDVRPGLWLDLTAHSRRWALSVSVASATGEADLVHRNATTDGMALDSALLAVAAKPCISGWVRACAGPYLGARVLSGSSVHESFVALQGEAGGALSLDRAFANGFRFAATVMVGATAGPLSAEAARTAGSRVDVTTALTLGYQVF